MTHRSSLALVLGILFLSHSLWAAEEKEKAKAGKDELAFQVHLIWGTNEKQNDPKLGDVSAELRERLQKIFRWNHYYEVKNTPLRVPTGGLKKVKLSDKCDIEVRDLGKPMLEVKLFGEGNLVRTVKKAVVPSECLVLAGDDKNDTAWFVVLKPKSSK